MIRPSAAGGVVRPATPQEASSNAPQLPQRESAYLHPGQIFVTTRPTSVATILGSCVAVCLWDPIRGLGGLNHYLLPYWAKGQDASARFGNFAIDLLLEKLLALGTRRSSLQAKLFGGACVMAAFRGKEGNLGAKNIQLAIERLEKEGIPILQRDVGGERGRKLIFQTDDGTAWVRHL